MKEDLKYEVIMYDDYKEDAFMIIKDENTTSLFADRRYEPIFQALRTGPLTVKDLVRRYNEIVFKIVGKMDLSKSEKIDLRDKMYRQEKTIYKYLNKLESHGIITPAGKRFLRGKTAAETLYGRTAKLFYFSDETKKDDLFEEMKLALPIVSKVLSLKQNNEVISTECLFKFLTKIFTHLDIERTEMMEKYSEELATMEEEIDYNKLRLALRILEYLFVILKSEEFKKDLQKCYQK